MQRVPVLRGDLDLKHRLMAADVFSFLRATFYRWAQLWPRDLPRVGRRARGAVGRRPARGELRHLARRGGAPDLGRERLRRGRDAALHAGPGAPRRQRAAGDRGIAADAHPGAAPARRSSRATRESLRPGGGAAVLAERYRWLRDLAIVRLKDQRPYWDNMRGLRSASGRVPPAVRRLLRGGHARARPGRALRPPPGRARQPGTAAPGRRWPSWRGGMVAREAKPLAPSAWLWARQAPRATHPRYARALRARRAGAGSVPRGARRVAHPAPGARLQPHRAREPAARPRRGPPAVDDGMGDGATCTSAAPRQRRAILADLGRRKNALAAPRPRSAWARPSPVTGASGARSRATTERQAAEQR